jgi:hypothetical protein
MMRFPYFMFFLIFMPVFLAGQNGTYPEFSAPVNKTLRLSGTFGELRSNHFHSGIDIKGSTGEAILSIEDGYVSRIKVSGGGYGKVLYITHPNGYTSVYAHLVEFNEAISAYVEDYQYRNETFDLEIHPTPEQFVVKKGERIGKMGMTGHAFGPHLHFEIRETATSRPVNPLLLGIQVEDDRKPKMHEIRLYELTNNREIVHATSYNLYQSKYSGKYKVKGDTVFTQSNKIGLALKAYDHMTAVSNWNGLYSGAMYGNDSLIFEFKMNSFSFDETRYINAHLDYEDHVTQKSYFNRCFLLPGNQLSIYERTTNDGILELKAGEAQKITMVAADAEGNLSTADFWVKRNRLPERKFQPVYNYLLLHDEENLIDNGSMILYMPKGTLYEDLYLDFASTTEESSGIYASYYHIHDYKTPVHKYYDLSIFPYKLPEKLKDKAFIAYCPPKGNIVNYGGKWEGKMLKTKVRDLGDFTVMVDTIAPTIKPYRFKSNMQGWKSLIFTIEDNFSTAGNARGISWYATIDDQWILMELDAKKDRLIYTFDHSRIERGKHQFKLTVWDGLGNKNVFEKTFVN